MKKRIILTETDIRDLVKESLLEYCRQSDINENKTAKTLAALGLGIGSIAGINYIPTDMNHHEKIQPIRVTNDDNNNDTISYVNDYYPSDELIEFIKSYETFHDGWVDDGTGRLTTGWGFKMTPELKKRFPTGMHRDKYGNTPEADAYLLYLMYFIMLGEKHTEIAQIYNMH